MSTTNLPAQPITDSAAATKLFFDSYGEQPLEFNAAEVDACIAFFIKKGFDNDAAIVVAAALLKQAKLDNLPIYNVLDSLAGFDELQISILVGEILNNNRVPTSTLGFRTTPVRPNQTRNIVA
jgi:hypothetical protein